MTSAGSAGRPARLAAIVLAADDFTGVRSVAQDADADPAPGWVWCDLIAPSMWERGEPPATSLVLDLWRTRS